MILYVRPENQNPSRLGRDYQVALAGFREPLENPS